MHNTIKEGSTVHRGLLEISCIKVGRLLKRMPIYLFLFLYLQQYIELYSFCEESVK